MANTTEELRQMPRWRVRIAVFLAVLLGLPVLLFFAVGALVDLTHVPPQLMELPPDWASQTAPASPGGSAAVLSDGSSLPPNPPPPGATDSDGDPSTDLLAPLEARLQDLGEQDGVRLYLDLLPGFLHPDKSGVETFGNLFYPRSKEGNPWRPGNPLPSGAAEWLMSHADIVEALLRLGESPDLPLHIRELVERHPEAPPFARDPDATRFLTNRDSFLWYGGRILIAEGQRRMEAGDFAGAIRSWRALVRLSMNEGADPVPELHSLSRVGVARQLDGAIHCLAVWAAENDVPTETLTDLQQTLAEAHRYSFLQNWIARERRQLYPLKRQQLIAEINNKSWYSHAFGWEARSFPWAGPGEHWATVMGVELLRVDRLGAMALQAMRNKRKAPEVLRECDRSQAEIVRRGRMTWPELAQVGRPTDPAEPRQPMPLFDESDWGRSVYTYDWAHEFVLAAEARLNLLRAAIQWRLAPPDAKPDPAAMKIEDRESPWRDPFAEAPFRAKALPDDGSGGGGVLLYSLGPDLKDQQGQIEYDPTNGTNGTASAGDLTLEVKRF